MLFHIGRKIQRIREMRGIKQEAVASELGITRQAVSKIEQSEQVDDDTIERISRVLGVTTEIIRNFNEDAMFNIIGNTVTNHDNASFLNYFPTFNPIDKLMELVEENKRLYERLLESEQQKVELLDKTVKAATNP